MNSTTYRYILALPVLLVMAVSTVTAQVSQEVLDSISTPDKVETSIGTLNFFDGAPSPETAEKAHDYLDTMLNWIVETKQIEPHTPVWQKYAGKDGQFGMAEFALDAEADQYTCPAGNSLQRYRRNFKKKCVDINRANTIEAIRRA